MTAPADIEREIDRFPAVLRTLIRTEGAAGNKVVEIGHSFPAAPVGAFAMLAGPVGSRPRRAGGGLRFFERRGSSWCGEWTDDQGYFFVLEPPLPQPAEPDMDAIRQAREPAPMPPPNRLLKNSLRLADEG